MDKKNSKIFCATLYLVFLASVFCIYFSPNMASAFTLEIEYPTVAKQTISSADTPLPAYAKYLYYAGTSLGLISVVLSLIIAGIMYFLSPASPQLLASAKDRVSGAISGLLILTLTYLIITTIDPRLNIITINKMPAVSPPVVKKAPGVYFYNSKGCEDDEKNKSTPNTSNLEDLGPLTNKVQSVGIGHDAGNNSYYISILYDEIGFRGKCQYINPNLPCVDVQNFAASASINIYERNPTGDGVYIYRKPCFSDQKSSNASAMVNNCNGSDTNKNDTKGGYYKIINDKIKGIYFSALEKLQYTGDNGACSVPEKEQTCLEYDINGKCVPGKRECPYLDGNNISSIVINGQYIVLLFYFDSKDGKSGPWTSCQEFPTPNDINRFGSQQLKWERIKNNNGVVPNYIAIIPVRKK